MAQSDGGRLDRLNETLLIPLCARALESRRPDALLRDEGAEALMARVSFLSQRAARLKIDPRDQVSVALRGRECDQHARDFLARSAKPTVVQIGCGLDLRFGRVDDGRVQWYDLDLPSVIDLRRQLIGSEGPRYHLLAASALDFSWMDSVPYSLAGSYLFLAEGLLEYFTEEQVRGLFLALARRYPGSELVCEVLSPLIRRMHNLRLRLERGRVGAPYHWTPRPSDPEAWGSGIRLLDKWFLYDRPERRLVYAGLVKLWPALGRPMGVMHYRLGTAPA